MKEFYSTKLPKWEKPILLGNDKYCYDGENNIGFYWLQFDLYSIKCDAEYFISVIKMVDFWDSINVNERHNYTKQLDYSNGKLWNHNGSWTDLAKKDFLIAVIRLYHFIKPLDIYGFREFVNSDNVIRTDNDIYTTQCSQYSKKFTLVELQNYFIKEYQI